MFLEDLATDYSYTTIHGTWLCLWVLAVEVRYLSTTVPTNEYCSPALLYLRGREWKGDRAVEEARRENPAHQSHPSVSNPARTNNISL